ncbi:GlxA family transcriptional regulator [Sansalvadorimonas verongulae]|uniref:GlxA family transcriptional regulator n=1 Tax=Sansalvadorimonas verongulae TaxID=2172824 RepID=UPI0012BD5111|nr:helix-turn-helix domain-containing protein [Sansalvadorimonas verongulae]MTI14378.1 helix-turn-helix domain-containing protein [Sansalvadorimonas verongulae]
MSVYLLALNGMIATSLTLPLEMLNAARHMHRASRQRSAIPRLIIVGEKTAPVITTGGLTLIPDQAYDDLPQADIIFVPSFWRNPKPLADQWPHICEWLKQQHEGGARLCATGTGVFLLAQTGLLDGKPATTHWFYLNLLHKMFPDLLLKQNHLITQSGRLFCAGSVNSIADLTIHLIESLFGQSISARVEQQFSPEIRRRYSDLFYSFESSAPHPDETIVLVQQWLHEHQQDVISMENVARLFTMSQRTLNRRFLDATGMTPTQWLIRLRIETARDLLNSTNLDIGDIALRCGFSDAGYFNRVFRKHMEITPGQYRASVRGKLFKP